MKNRSAKFLLWSIIISGVLIVLAIGIAYKMLKNASQNQIVPSQNTNNALVAPSADIKIKKFTDNIYGYSFEYPTILIGGFQKLTPELEKGGVKESIVLETPRDSKDRLAVIISVEDRPDNLEKIESLANNYEEGSKTFGIELFRITSENITVDGIDVIERKYSIQKSSMPYSAVRFAMHGTRLYVFSVFRSSNNDDIIEMEKTILDSIHFSTK
ncbi:MAG: hypothetical protein AAB795_01040 [Patescibacteria group bacterium]